MSDYARKIAGQLWDQANVEHARTGAEVDWRHVVELGVRAGYGFGWGARNTEDSK